ncbi:MAG: GIY-YIG nuclease family protein [Planctomycetota bacterium]|jgi:predicted GIY-YIG superfamily endonuclease
MLFVYILGSESHPTQTYIGLTEDLDERLKRHNSGGSPHTSKHMPWRLETYIAFNNADLAKQFETYLKSASGRAFAKRRLVTPAQAGEW